MRDLDLHIEPAPIHEILVAAVVVGLALVGAVALVLVAVAWDFIPPRWP